MRCDQEMCPMWDGDSCPCDTFGLDRDDLPTDGVFTVTLPDMTAEEIIDKYLDDAFELHPGHMTASGLLARLADGGYEVVGLNEGKT